MDIFLPFHLPLVYLFILRAACAEQVLRQQRDEKSLFSASSLEAGSTVGILTKTSGMCAGRHSEDPRAKGG